MPIRKLTIHASIVGVMLTSSTLASAGSAPWNGSYAADGACFCVGDLGREIDSRITPTPIGGQSVAQVCERVGAGPKLQMLNGKFNFTVYPDAQCGHGPALDANADITCLGHLGVAGEDCSGKGPKWDLTSAFAEQPKWQAKQIDATDTEVQEVVVTGGSRYIKPPVSKSTTSVEEIVSMRESAIEIEQDKIITAQSVKRSSSRPQAIAKAEPQTKEQIRARQLEQLAAARERAAQKEATQMAIKTAKLEHATKLEEASRLEQAAKLEEAARLEQAARLEEAARLEQAAKLEQAAIDKESAQSVAQSTNAKTPTVQENVSVPALKVPTAIASSSTHDFDYVEGAPVNYDYGGAGVSIAASKSSHNRVQYVLNAAAADGYGEVAVGVGLFVKPVLLDRVTFMLSAGVEHGQFNFQRDNIAADLSDTGAFLRLGSRLVVTPKFKLQAGVGYSSFFEGDAIGFGAAFYHLTSQLDLTAKAEAGDNDMLGFGFRFHY